jgi:glycerophosphoryl diester phosphodiesterase
MLSICNLLYTTSYMLIIGHRGAKGQATENTLIGLQAGLDSRVDQIEIDARVTKDGIVVLMHDAAYKRRGKEPLVVSTTTYRQLRRVKKDLTTLVAAIDYVGTRIPLMIEVKSGVPTAPIVTIINAHLNRGWKTKDFLLASYSQPVLLELHRALPAIDKIVIENWSSIRAVRRARQVHTKRLSMLEYWLWTGFIRSMARRGYKIYSFPPKDSGEKRVLPKLFGLSGHTNMPSKARRWAKAGLAGVITDYPERYTQTTNTDSKQP